MALQGSGAISFDNLRNEYGNGGSIALSEMYRGGSFVANHSNNGNVPTSGTISLSNFYGQNNTAPNWSMTLTVGSITGKISEFGYGAAGYGQNNNPSYGSVSDNTVDILGGAFFRQCKYGNINQTIFVEIDGGSTSWSSIVINGTTFNRTSMSQNTDAWSLTGQSNPFGTSNGATLTVTINP
jgi:hypothetical protein